MRYARPTTLPEALGLLAQDGTRVLAGGTDLYPATAAQTLSEAMVDLSAVTDLHGIHQRDGHLRIGAMTCWTEIAEASLPPALHALQQAARQVGGRQIQNAGTIGGNLCNASPAADGVPPLLAVDTEVELAGQDGVRRLPLSAFLLGPRRTALKRGEVLSALMIPSTALGGRSRFLKLGARSSLVISIAMVAARIETAGGKVSAAALAIGSCSPVATRLPDLEARLIGAEASACSALIHSGALASALTPIDDIRATAVYRKGAAAELLARAVQECLA